MKTTLLIIMVLLIVCCENTTETDKSELPFQDSIPRVFNMTEEANVLNWSYNYDSEILGLLVEAAPEDRPDYFMVLTRAEIEGPAHLHVANTYYDNQYHSDFVRIKLLVQYKPNTVMAWPSK